MAKCIIVCPLYQGECMERVLPQPGDLLLCADAGYRAAAAAGLKPDLVIGDFDTMPVTEADGTQVVRLPVFKDDTDLGVCLQEGRRRGYRSFLLAGCIGGRLDHTVACLQLMAEGARKGESITVLDAVNEMTILTPGRYELPQKPGRLMSLLAFTDEVRDVCLTGTEWKLEHAVLTSERPLGISNIIREHTAELSFSEGLLMVCYAVNRTWTENG